MLWFLRKKRLQYIQRIRAEKRDRRLIDKLTDEAWLSYDRMESGAEKLRVLRYLTLEQPVNAEGWRLIIQMAELFPKSSSRAE